jgi:large subunit ribosomal protein L17
MRHGKKFNHLGRKSAHRKAMLSNMASSLIEHKRINTTVAKARELRKYIEPLITKSKDDTTHSRRIVFGYLKNKYAVTELFRDVAVKVADRPGGYTRIIKTGQRLGDSAEMCMIELVDYNELYNNGKEAKKGRSRRTKKKSTDTTVAAPVAAEVVEEVVTVVEPETEAPEATVEEPETPQAAENENEEKKEE